MTDAAHIQIRSMVEGDLDAVLEIEQVSYPVPWNRDHFLSELVARYSFPYIAVANGEVAGYVCLMSLFEEAQILNIAVHPGKRGRGIACVLMDYACVRAIEKGAEILSLEVRVTNVAAIALYERCGFVRSGVRRKYYEGRDDAVLMEKRLR
ncbi:MAG: ribosomal protein S18-alanine N-acetyltransferase [Desulfuromonadaceae bacterium]|nr:ribosomal protein S18-alanine N-acetyltransferase [Desulfuromonadaceae bacterium]MDD5107188.1 ribosomal protein S18-alanine N-acetyltransferase [Desulfuromonadaceae bacterium]